MKIKTRISPKEALIRQVFELPRISYSMLNTWLSCRQKSYWTYIAKIKRPPTIPLLYGGAFHWYLEALYKTRDLNLSSRSVLTRYQQENPELFIPELKTEWEMKKESFLALCEGYRDFYRDEILNAEWLGLELDFTARPEFAKNKRMEGYELELRGIFDGILKRGARYAILETKTRSALEDENTLLEYLSNDLQTHFYCYAYKTIYGEYPEGILYNCVRKPRQQIKMGESAADFHYRVLEEIHIKPESYFQRIFYKISPRNELRFFRHQLLPLSIFILFVYLYMSNISVYRPTERSAVFVLLTGFYGEDARIFVYRFDSSHNTALIGVIGIFKIENAHTDF